MSIYDHLEFKHLKFIIAIAEEGTFTAAAARLPLAQSALSRQIAELEDALRVQIFDRSRGGATLTDAGESLLRYAYEFLQTRIEIVNAMQAIQQASLHPFRIGFTPFVDRHVIEAVCSTYREVTLPFNLNGFLVQPIMHEALVVCLRKRDPLANGEFLKPQDLSKKLGIFSDPKHHPQAHLRLLEMLEEQGIEPRMLKPTSNAEHVQWMVRENVCLALVREREPLHEDLTTRPIAGVSWTVDSALVYEQERQASTLPLLIHELGRRFSMPKPDAHREAPIRKRKNHQDTLFADEVNRKIG